MRILSITAGAAGMYCGSCLRDNSFAAELMARGHDVTLLPLYTPTNPDEPNVSRNRVLFGGISVYLQQHLALFRRTPRFLDRLNLGPVPTIQLNWLQPHEGNIIDFLFRARAFQMATVAAPQPAAV